MIAVFVCCLGLTLQCLRTDLAPHRRLGLLGRVDDNVVRQRVVDDEVGVATADYTSELTLNQRLRCLPRTRRRRWTHLQQRRHWIGPTSKRRPTSWAARVRRPAITDKQTKSCACFGFRKTLFCLFTSLNSNDITHNIIITARCTQCKAPYCCRSLPSVRLTIDTCDVEVPWSYKLGYFKSNYTNPRGTPPKIRVEYGVVSLFSPENLRYFRNGAR